MNERKFDLKPRESKNLPPEKLQGILSKIYPDETVRELMGKLLEADQQEQQEIGAGHGVNKKKERMI